jgi:serine protease Do
MKSTFTHGKPANQADHKRERIRTTVIPAMTTGMATVVLLLATAISTPAADGPEYFHDKLISSKLLRSGEKLLNANRHTPASELRAQLSRSSCRLALPNSATHPLTTAELVKTRRPGVLVVGAFYKCDKCTKWHTGNATGAALTKDGIFVTCYHVIAATNRESFHIMTADGRTAPVVEVLAADRKSDIAICRASDIELEPIPLGDSIPPAGSPIRVISHPSGNYFTLSTGHISRYFFKPISKIRSVPFMAITAEFAKGSSGGPVLDANGNLVGMAAATSSIYYDVQDGRKTNLQMVIRQCVPLESVRDLIRRP